MQITVEHDRALLQTIAEKKTKFWNKGEFKWKMHSGQRKIHDEISKLNHKVRIAVVECARGYGKSYLETLMAIRDCLTPPFNHPVYIVAPEKQQCSEIIRPIIMKIAEDAPKGLIRQLKSESKFMVGNVPLILAGFNRDSIDRLRGQRAKNIYCEEVRDVPAEQYLYGLKDVLSPMVLHSLGRIYMLTTTPRELDHPFLNETVPEAKLNNAYFRYTIFDNPLLSEEQIQIAWKESGSSDTSITWLREYMCDSSIRDLSRAIVPEFNKSHHVGPFEHAGRAKWFISGDMGGVRDKTCIILCYYDFISARLCIVGERVFDAGTPTTEIVAGSLELEKVAKWDTPRRYMDAHGQSLVDLNKYHDYSCSLPNKDDFDAQINALQIAFCDNRIFIHEDCKFLITSLEHGRLNEKRNDYMRTEALGHCDAIAALSYAWRNVDTSNPFPQGTLNSDTHWQRPSSAPQPQMARVAKALFPRMNVRR